MRMVRWCIRLTRLTLVCEVIRYRLVPADKITKKDFSGWRPAIAFLYLFLFHNRKRGSASYIVREVCSVRERERERERETETDGSDVTIVALKLAMKFGTFPCQNSHKWRRVYIFPCQKFALFVSPFTLPISPFLNGHHCGAEIRNEFTLPLRMPKNFSLFVPNLSNGARRATSDRKL